MIAILKYNAGNIGSVQNALQRLQCECIITDNEQALLAAEKVIIPGVGEASTAMRYLKEKNLHTLIPCLKQPVLGICLGLQLFCKHSEEGNTECLGIFDVEVKKFPPLKIVPHMGWNNLQNLSGKLFEQISTNDNFYFVHSYFAALSENTTATCNYINPFSAALQRENFYAAQFHPEKSALAGEQFLKNFLKL